MTERPLDPRIHDYLDDELTPDERARFEAELRADPVLSAEVGRMRDLLEDLSGLAGDAAPARDLWDGIEARLDADARELSTDTGAARARPGRGRRVTLGVSQLIAAGVALMLVTGTATWVALRPEAGPPPVAVEATGSDPADQVSPPSPQFVRDDVFREYESAVADLQDVLDAGRDRLSPETIAVLEESLAAIDAAIEDARTALREDPASGALHRLLRRHMKTKLEVLQHTAAAIQSNA